MEPTTVLVIDPDSDSRTIFSSALTYAGYRVLTAPSWPAAAPLLSAARPAAIVFDPYPAGTLGVLHPRTFWQLPDDVPLLVVSAVPLQAPASPGGTPRAFLPKPCLPRTLLDALQRLLRPLPPAAAVAAVAATPSRSTAR